ncbi:MAG: signal recognition particle protein [Candidatus Aenigmatarchaeota archaeon]|nr:MAG: signal recognition particle protein [Candidatus Aenigmarchaeota archaeon]
MLEKLGSALKGVMDKLLKKGYVDADVLDEVAKDIQRSLLASDVEVKLVFELTKTIKDRSLKEKPPAGVTQREHVVRVVYDELVSFLGKEAKPLPVQRTKILLVGLFGSGKTTTAGKLAKYYQRKGLRPVLVACDTFRPAAYEQLVQIGSTLGVPVIGEPGEKDSSKVLQNALKQTSKYDVVIVDSSGRDALDGEMINEVKKLNAILAAEERLMVIPADLGQQAGPQARAFRDALGITGVIVTKMDGTAKGGGALSACAATGAPVRLIGVGEKLDALEEYDPKRFVSRLIGFGDLEGLLERAKEMKIDEAQAQKLVTGEFTLDEFYNQIKQVKGAGSLAQMAEMIPGIGKLIGTKIPKEELERQEARMERFGHIIGSMTPQEKKTPEVLNASRIKRIAAGSGSSEQDVRELLKMFEQSRKMMKTMGKGGKQMKALMKQFGMKM